MPINGRTLADVTNDLTLTSTSEVTFRNAATDVATQVNANEVDTNAARNITLTGDVAGTTAFNLGTDGARDISIATTIQNMSVSGTDIQNNSITNQQIAMNTITNNEIATNTITQDRIAPADKVRITVRNAAGTIVRQFDGLSIT